MFIKIIVVLLFLYSLFAIIVFGLIKAKYHFYYLKENGKKEFQNIESFYSAFSLIGWTPLAQILIFPFFKRTNTIRSEENGMIVKNIIKYQLLSMSGYLSFLILLLIAYIFGEKV
jgi:hypothetical protein